VVDPEPLTLAHPDPPMPSPHPLARRLIRTMFPWFLLLAFGMVVAQVTVQYFSVNADIDGDLASLCATIEQPVADQVWELNLPALGALTEGTLSHSIVSGVQVTTSEGQVLVMSGQLPMARMGKPWFLPNLYKQASLPLYFRSQRGSRNRIGTLSLYSSPGVVWQRVRAGLLTALVSSIAMALGVGGLCFVTLRTQLSRSVAGISEAIAGWQSQPMERPVPRIQYPYRDELGDLVHALNENRAHLAASMGELNRLNRNQELIIATRTADLREAKERAEAADRIKSAFLATMSHELRTPLNSIIGFTGILVQGLVGPLNDEQKKQLGMVRDSSNHLLELINDVLDISKIEAGQLEVTAQRFDLREALEKTIRSLGPLARKRGIDLELRLAPEVGSLVGDRRRVEQIVMNLAGNAIKFTEQGGVTVDCRVQGPEVEVRVRDTGIGIGPEDLGLLFRPFHQVDSGTTRKYEGTGLGLSICKRLVELMGGRIWVISAVGEGSTFSFALPLQDSGGGQA